MNPIDKANFRWEMLSFTTRQSAAVQKVKKTIISSDFMAMQNSPRKPVES
jgi:hypothetical protein